VTLPGDSVLRTAGSLTCCPDAPVTYETPGKPKSVHVRPDVFVKINQLYTLPAAPPPGAAFTVTRTSPVWHRDTGARLGVGLAVVALTSGEVVGDGGAAVVGAATDGLAAGGVGRPLEKTW
jgi:hypothetical protein